MKVVVGTEEVDLNPDILTFSEATLNSFLMKDATLYAYYSAKYTEAQCIAAIHDDEADEIYAAKFSDYKGAGATDKLAEAKATADSLVSEARRKAKKSKQVKDTLWGFLRSLDKAHENALNLAYNIRKELQVLQNQSVPSLESILN